MNTEPIESGAPLLEIGERIATITLRRPEVSNRLEASDLVELIEHIEQVNASDALVLRWRALGKYFCSGFNINKLGVAKSVNFEDVARAIENCRAITIAVLQGGIFGGATDLALRCDFRIASTNAQLHVPAVRLGAHFNLSALQRFSSRLGIDNAKRILLAAEKFDAQAMKDCGYATALVAPDALHDYVQSMSEQFASSAPLPLLSMKKHLNRIAANTLDVDEFSVDFNKAFHSTDAQEGRVAWQERRPPRFTGN
ncbi:MAG: enoyl-CoA hydratase/isomerase family protein [Janthinobacterium lividum]